MLSSWRTHTHRYWRPAWWRWDACPTSTITNGSSAKPVAIAGSAFALQAACGRGREAGPGARSNRCLRWRVTSTCPQSPQHEHGHVWDWRLLSLVLVTLYYYFGPSSEIKAIVRRENVNKDELFVQKIKNFIKHNCFVRAWKETKQYKNPKHIYIYSKTCRVTHIFSGKFKNTVMSFKIGFVQRHWVAFQVTGAMRWHVWPLMNNINTDVKSDYACSLIQSCKTPPCYL